MAAFVCGTSGYSYEHWRGVFYPPEVRQPHRLEYYAQHFGAVELNVTYYNLPKREVFESWRQRTPDDFRFAIKGSRLITHYHRLHDVDEAVATFFEHAAGLGGKLAVVLWQLRAEMKPDAERLDTFCALVARVSKVRQVFEFRDDSWFDEAIYEVLRRHHFGLCIADSPTLKTPQVLTADFTYLRFHGSTKRYDSDYTDAELRPWAKRARGWLDDGRDVFAFFNNDPHGYAVANARRLRELVAGNTRSDDAQCAASAAAPPTR